MKLNRTLGVILLLLFLSTTYVYAQQTHPAGHHYVTTLQPHECLIYSNPNNQQSFTAYSAFNIYHRAGMTTEQAFAILENEFDQEEWNEENSFIWSGIDYIGWQLSGGNKVTIVYNANDFEIFVYDTLTNPHTLYGRGYMEGTLSNIIVIEPTEEVKSKPNKVVYKINSINSTKALTVILNDNGRKEPIGVLNLNTIIQWQLAPDPQAMSYEHLLPDLEPGIYKLEFYETNPGTGQLEELIHEHEFTYDPTSGGIGSNKYLYKDKIQLMNVLHHAKSDLVVSVKVENKATGLVEPGHLSVSVMSTVNGQPHQVDFGKDYPNTGIWQTIVGWVTGKPPKAQYYDYNAKIEFDHTEHESDNGWKYVKNTEEILVIVGYTNSAGDFIVANHHKIPVGSIIGPQGYDSSHGPIDTEEQEPDGYGQYVNDPTAPVEQSDNADNMNAGNGILGFFVSLNKLFAAIIALMVKVFRLLSSLLFIEPDTTHIHAGVIQGMNLIRSFSILEIGIWNAISSVLVFGYVLGVIKLVRKTF